MKIHDRETTVPTSWLLDEMVSRIIGTDLAPGRNHAYLSKIGDLSDAEIEDYCTALNKDYPGLGAGVRDVLMKLRDDAKKE